MSVNDIRGFKTLPKRKEWIMADHIGVRFNKDLGRPLSTTASELTKTNADGKPVVPLTHEQKYLFDKDGWLLIPGVLTDSEIEEMRDFCYQLKNAPETISPSYNRSTYGGPLEALIDHPVVVAFANEFLASPYLTSESCYGFRMETSFLMLRSTSDDPPRKFGPHNGNGMFRMPGDCHQYQCLPGQAYSGLTRVVWELNPVGKEDGGTLFVTGSHKSAFTAPAVVRKREWEFWDTYSCPAGSVIFFTEAITHSGQPWQNPDTDRVSVFNGYNSVDKRWKLSLPPQALIERMPPKRQTLFRDAYVSGNVTGKSFSMSL